MASSHVEFSELAKGVLVNMCLARSAIITALTLSTWLWSGLQPLELHLVHVNIAASEQLVQIVLPYLSRLALSDCQLCSEAFS